MKLKPDNFIPQLRRATKSVKRYSGALLTASSLTLASLIACQSGFISFPTSFWQQASAGPTAPFVNSVQQVSITIGSGATSNTASISSVSTSLSILVYQGITFTAADDAAATVACRATLTNSTTVTATRNTSDTDSVTINVTVIECTSSLINSIQYGTVAITASTSGTASVSSVTTTVAAPFWLGASVTSTQTSAFGTRGFTDCVLTNSTTITATQGSSAYNSTTSFCLVEFKSNCIQSRQAFTQVVTNGSTTNGQTITSVNTSNTILVFGGYYGASGQGRLSQSRIQLTSSTNVNLVNGEAIDTLSRQVSYVVLEFVTGVLNSAPQQSTISLVSTTSATATLSPSVSTSKTMLAFLGAISTGSSTSDNNQQWQKVTLTNGTTVTGTVNTSGSRGQAVGFGAYEFK